MKNFGVWQRRSLMSHLIPVTTLLLSLAFSLLVAEGKTYESKFWSIDCGGSGSFVDGNGISWVNDQGFVRTGESQTVQDPTKLNREFQTLRVFKYQKKNCYTIPVLSGTKVLVRLTFNYGNYDGKSSPPEFDVICDATYIQVVPPMTLTDTSNVEVIYVTKGNSTGICFGRRFPGQDPFVSAIEVRTLAQPMYENGLESGKVLVEDLRIAFGAANTIRYPYDKYDRIWVPYSGHLTVVKSNTTVPVLKTDDDPPDVILQSAVAPAYGSNNITFSFADLSVEQTKTYLTMYFREMYDLTTSPGQTRSFLPYWNENPMIRQPIVPRYREVLELTSSRRDTTNSTVLGLLPTADTNLPPIVNALELFYVVDSSDLTGANDVAGLSVLQENFKDLKHWSGDPCLPKDYNWEWVGCYPYTIPVLYHLNLSSYGLSGTLPDFSSMKDLEVIDLHNNSFRGAIPEFLNNFPKLRILNLAYNKFTSVPSSLKNNKKINLILTGNPLPTSPPPSPNVVTKAKVPVLLPFALPVILSLLF